MKLSQFDYVLPEELIAQEPKEPRDSSRLMVVDRHSGRISHKVFTDIVESVERRDVMVFNDTKVLKARLIGRKETGATVEVLLLHDLGQSTWEALARPGRRLKPGSRVVFGDGMLCGEIIGSTAYGGRTIRFEYNGDFQQIVERLGRVPLPPYIKKQLKDDSRYQTVYARNVGSSAAPTAGLHFTNGIMRSLREKGVSIVFITLHVGIDTFKPVTVENIEEHKMHSELFTVSDEVALTINESKAAGGRIFAVGTTVTRTLESVAKDGVVKPGSGWTDLFICPGYRFKAVDALITNFHLPKSTLLMLVSAFAGVDLIKRAYQEAVQERYRFFSFGDAMLIL